MFRKGKWVCFRRISSWISILEFFSFLFPFCPHIPVRYSETYIAKRWKPTSLWALVYCLSYSGMASYQGMDTDFDWTLFQHLDKKGIIPTIIIVLPGPPLHDHMHPHSLNPHVEFLVVRVLLVVIPCASAWNVLFLSFHMVNSNPDWSSQPKCHLMGCFSWPISLSEVIVL